MACAVLVDDAQAIAIGVPGDAEVGVLAYHFIAQHVHRFRVLRVRNVGRERAVEFVVNGDDFAADSS